MNLSKNVLNNYDYSYPNSNTSKRIIPNEKINYNKKYLFENYIK